MALKISNTYEPGEFARLYSRLQRSASNVIRIKRCLLQGHADWTAEDARIGLFSRLHNQFNPAMFTVLSMDRHFSDPNWWPQNVGQPLNEQQIRVELLNLSQFVKIGLLHQVFSSLETACRAFLRAIDPVACAGGTAEFKGVYDHLLGSRLGIATADIAVLDLLRNLRNTIHNGGVVLHRRRIDQQVTYRGRLYDFRHEDIVQFAAWNPLLDWIDDAIVLFERVVNHPDIAGLPVPVLDLSAMTLDDS